MSYFVVISRHVLKSLENIPEPDYIRIKKVVYSLAENPRPSGYKKLNGRSGYRIRQGDYRIIYEINDKILTVSVIEIGNRKDIYR